MAVLPFIQRQAIKRFREGSRGPWGAVAAAAVGLRAMKHFGGRKDDVVYHEVLEPGQQVVVTHRPESVRTLSRAEAKAAKAAEKQAKVTRKQAKATKKEAKAAEREAKVTRKQAKAAEREAKVTRKQAKATRKRAKAAKRTAKAAKLDSPPA